jgi:hypothetical protein
MAVSTSNSAKPVSPLAKTFWLSVLAGFLLLIANSAIWLNNYVFNEDNFSNVVTTAITSESSRQAIAERVTDAAFQDRPVLKKVAGDVSTKIVSGLLATNQADTAISEVTRRLNVVLTSNNPEPVVFDLTGIKGIVSQLVNVSASLGREPQVDPANIPDEIVILDTANLPNFYKWSVAFLWIAPLAFIGGAAALLYPYLKRNRQIKPMLLTQGAVITAFGLLGLLVGPLFRPPLLANVKTSQGRVVIGNIYDGFIATFNAQTRLIIVFGIIIILIAGAMYIYQVAVPAIKNHRQSKPAKTNKR